jgi:hypothetical protein
MTHNNYVYSIYRGLAMPDTIKKTRYFLDIDPVLRNRVKAFAALKGKTMRDWLTEAIITKLEDEIDASEGLASLADTDGTMSLEAYLASRQGEPKRTE